MNTQTRNEIRQFLEKHDYQLHDTGVSHTGWLFTHIGEDGWRPAGNNEQEALKAALNHLLSHYLGAYWQNVDYTVKSMDSWIGVENTPIVMTAWGYHEALEKGE